MSSSGLNLANYLIPLEEITRATENFSDQRCIGEGGFGKVYKGQLSKRWKNLTAAFKRLTRDSYQGVSEFRNEVDLSLRFHHENIVSFIGYCDEQDEMILVYEYAINGSLDRHLEDPNKIRCLTWTQRLKICLGAARGLDYLHSGLGEHSIVIHRNIKSGDILLDENLVAKICDFGLSLLTSRNLPNTQLFTEVAGTQYYVDPVYQESGILRKEVDVYSFGVLLFEMLSGMLAYIKRSNEDDKPERLITSVRRHKNQRVKLIDPDMKGQIHTRSFNMFTEIAYRCISMDLDYRPSMKTVVKTLEEALNIQISEAHAQDAEKTKTHTHNMLYPGSSDEVLIIRQEPNHLNIPLQVIQDCTDDFNERNFIGKGGYGRVYKGFLTWADHVNMPVAVKRLDLTGFQGNKEFHTEVTMLSQYQHRNIITLIGYCNDNKELILVYEYARRGSLDTYLRGTAMLDGLSWLQLLNICIDVASALDYLHNHVAEKHRIIHRDIKSANVLLDENWNAKLSDFGLAKIGLARQPNTIVITNIAGTHGYNDPQYERTGFLSKESDVYSFGVVLFEVLCGRLACVSSYHDERRFLHHLARTFYEKGKLEEIIDHRIIKDIKPKTLSMFSAIAYQCLQETREERPPIKEVVFQLNEARKIQLEDEEDELSFGDDGGH